MTRTIRRLLGLMLGPKPHRVPLSDGPGTPDVWLAGLRLGG
ncbi:hypothetical protein [Streptomyces fulvoviolaceus]|nr:hypothetical protein [Streptomyces fulvoviolaceus]MCT9082067.1 hypothetical protein [Streptomyces fulvoviolaceus]